MALDLGWKGPLQTHILIRKSLAALLKARMGPLGHIWATSLLCGVLAWI